MKTNSKDVKRKVYNHIIEHLEGLDYEGCKTNEQKVKKQIDYMINKNESVYQACKRFVEGGTFEVYYHDVRQFINTLELNNKSNKNFNDTQVWLFYVRLLSITLYDMYFGVK